MPRWCASAAFDAAQPIDPTDEVWLAFGTGKARRVFDGAVAADASRDALLAIEEDEELPPSRIAELVQALDELSSVPRLRVSRWSAAIAISIGSRGDSSLTRSRSRIDPCAVGRRRGAVGPTDVYSQPSAVSSLAGTLVRMGAPAHLDRNGSRSCPPVHRS
jgi:hypothetical protein